MKVTSAHSFLFSGRFYLLYRRMVGLPGQGIGPLRGLYSLKATWTGKTKIHVCGACRNGTPSLCRRQPCCPNIISGLAEVVRSRIIVLFWQHRCLAKLRRLCSAIKTLLQSSCGFHDTSISSFALCFYWHVFRKAPTLCWMTEVPIYPGSFVIVT